MVMNLKCFRGLHPTESEHKRFKFVDAQTLQAPRESCLEFEVACFSPLQLEKGQMQ